MFLRISTFPILILSTVSIVSLCAPFPASHSRQGRCGGTATNYLATISSHKGCLDACNRDERCCHYSYHTSDATNPDQDVCYLFYYGLCKIMIDGSKHWRTGKRTTVSRKCKHMRIPRRFG